MKYIVTFKLISDLCSSNGTTNGRMVDTDVCLDADAKPYIPAKRIKGVLLQAYLDYSDITGTQDKSELIFGEEDSEKEKMYVSDAKFILNDNSDNIYYRTQNKIDDNSGTTKDGSLRTLMVVKRGLKFEFELEVNENIIDEPTLIKILGLLTHIGLNRNRGFGQVQFESLKEYLFDNDCLNINELKDNAIYRHEILCYATNDILLPEENSEVSGSVIPGSSLYGFFAYQYIKNTNCKEPLKDTSFIDIFYKGGVNFSFGFISDNVGTNYNPLPSCILKGKNIDLFKLVLTKEEQPQNSEEVIKFKPISDRFGILDIANKELRFKDIDFRFNYHHQRNKEEMGKGLVKEDNFFQYKAILSGQYFKFSLTGYGKYLKLLLKDLSYLHIGKSRTAQYGTLKICPKLSRYTEIKNDEGITLNAKYYLACVETPIILNNKSIDSAPNNLDLDLFLYTLNKQYHHFVVVDDCYRLTRKLISGFNMTWKKPKSSLYAIAPASYVLLSSNVDEKFPDVIHIGKRCNEGFGQIRLTPLDKKENVSLTLKTNYEDINDSEEDIKPTAFDISLAAKEKAIEEFNSNNLLKAFDQGLLSRLLLMLRQVDTFDDFQNNVNTITMKDKKEKAIGLIRKFKDYFVKDYDNNFKPYFFTLLTLIKYNNRTSNRSGKGE